MARAARGFTLIEVMIAVTLVSILVLLALPAYQNYTLRAKVSEAFTLGAPLRTRISNLYQESGSFPADNEAAALDPPADYAGEFVGAVEILPEGVVRVSFSDPALAGKTVTFTATASGPSLVWTCSATVPKNVLPPSCR